MVLPKLRLIVVALGDGAGEGDGDAVGEGEAVGLGAGEEVGAGAGAGDGFGAGELHARANVLTISNTIIRLINAGFLMISLL